MTVKGLPTSNHPSLSPFTYAGNTPTGDYISPGVVDTSGWNQASYGPWGGIRLTAVAGDALLAQDVFGRKGLLIHGGAPGRFDGYRSTLGCLRVSDNDMRTLVALISNAANNASAMRCEGLSIQVTVRE
jgi:lipoprotein-anchoring transpeptidase ErfK/SrfK